MSKRVTLRKPSNWSKPSEPPKPEGATGEDGGAERLAQILNVFKSLFSDQGFNGTANQDTAHATRKATHDHRSGVSSALY
jgi:hypothetical protein